MTNGIQIVIDTLKQNMFPVFIQNPDVASRIVPPPNSMNAWSALAPRNDAKQQENDKHVIIILNCFDKFRSFCDASMSLI